MLQSDFVPYLNLVAWVVVPSGPPVIAKNSFIIILYLIVGWHSDLVSYRGAFFGITLQFLVYAEKLAAILAIRGVYAEKWSV